MAHAFLSPSASHRWLHCTAAPELESKVEDQSSSFAEEGTVAHAICEAKLREYLAGREVSEGERVPTDCEFFAQEYGVPYQDHELFSEEMNEACCYYADAVISAYTEALKTTPDAKLLVETQLTIMPQLFGTVDAMIIQDGQLEVFDFKYGKGVKVSAEHNPQMMIYAVAAWLEYSDFYRIDSVKMTIVQPRVYNTNTWEIPEPDLMSWNAEVLMPTVVHILEGKDLSQEPGEWCKFCKVKRNCKALTLMALSTSKAEDPRLLTTEELAMVLGQVETVKNWCETISTYALQLALDGNKVPGYKLVEGRSKRAITDEAGFIAALKANGAQDEDLYKPRELQSLTFLEKKLGKKVINGCGDYIVKAPGKPTLAIETDPRMQYNKKTAEDDFSGIAID